MQRLLRIQKLEGNVMQTNNFLTLMQIKLYTAELPACMGLFPIKAMAGAGMCVSRSLLKEFWNSNIMHQNDR